MLSRSVDFGDSHTSDVGHWFRMTVNLTRPKRTVILSQRARWRENPPVVPASPCQSAITQAPIENVQPVSLNRREGALLLPAAGTRDNEKFQCKHVTSYGFAEKQYRFATFPRRKEQAPSLRSRWGIVRLPQHCTTLKTGNGRFDTWRGFSRQ